MIADYLDALASALSYDRALSRCVRQEVEDHLSEAVAADPDGDRLEAERRAIAKFGDPHVIAAQFAIVSLSRQARRVGVALIVVVATVFTSMKARVAWYAFTQWTMRDDLRIAGRIAGSIDRYAFWLSVIIGIAGFAYITGNYLRQGFYLAHRRQTARFFILSTAATTALIISVISDGVLTALQLLGTGLRVGVLVPLGTMAIEVACAGMLIVLLRGIAQRAAYATALLNR